MMNTSRTRPVIIAICGIVALIGLVFSLQRFGGSTSASGMAEERAAIEKCREVINDARKELSTRRSIVANCDKLALDFTAKYGFYPEPPK
jgi:hypothetical protein